MTPEIIIVLFGISIQIIFLFKRELLTNKQFEKWIWIGSLILFLIGYLLYKNYGDRIKSLPFLMVPIMAYALFRIQLWIYIKLFNSTPVDTLYSMDLKLMRSGIFNFIFWVTSIMIPVFLAYKLLNCEQQ